MAQHIGEGSERVIELFGCDTLPTPYLAFIPAEEVLERIQALNSGAEVIIDALEGKQAVPGVPLDFGNLEDPRKCTPDEIGHIRVGYGVSEEGRSVGAWSLLGKASVLIGENGEKSMQLRNYD